MVDVPNREEMVRKVVGLCNRVPGSTQWNAAEWMYDELAALLSERERRNAQGVTPEAAYLAGFMASGEGWNGEYPYAGVDMEQEPYWLKVRDERLAALRAAAPSLSTSAGGVERG